MKRRNWLFLPVTSVLILFAADFAFAQTSAEAKNAAQFIERFQQALKAGDRDAVLSALAEEAIIFESGYAESKSDYAASHLAADIVFAQTTTRAMKKTTTRCVKSICVVMQESETTGTYKDKPVSSFGVETSVLQGQKDAWKIMHLHWSSHK